MEHTMWESNNYIYEAAAAAQKTAQQKTAAPPPDPVKLPATGMTYFPLQKAVLCMDCNNVSDGKNACPACGSNAVGSLSKMVGGHVDSSAVNQEPAVQAPPPAPTTLGKAVGARSKK